MKPTHLHGLHNTAFAHRAAPFEAAGVLGAAAIHVTDLLAHRARVEDPLVLLGLAFSIQAPLEGSVGVDLRTVKERVFVERALEDAALAERLSRLPWPTHASWHADVAACSALVGTASMEDSRPFVQDGELLLPRRQWRYQERLARVLEERASSSLGGDTAWSSKGLAALLPRLFGNPAGPLDRQRLAAATAVLQPTTIITGGPGTGKTYTVARLLLVLRASHVAVHGREPRVALTAPTGKAAVRMVDALKESVASPAFDDAERAWLGGLDASTLHRLLGANPSRVEMFTASAANPIQADVVVVDEASMIDLAMMCRLVEAVRPEARLVLLGDPNQLASVEAGCVLADLASGVEAESVGVTPQQAVQLAQLDPEGLANVPTRPDGKPLQNGMVHLNVTRRTKAGSALQALASSIAQGNAAGFDAATTLLSTKSVDVELLPHASTLKLGGAALGHIMERAGEPIRLLARADQTGNLQQAHMDALAALESFRVLTPHRAGPFGVATLNRTVVDALKSPGANLGGARMGDVNGLWQGRPILVTRNSADLGLMNGDVGLVMRCLDGRLRVGFAGKPGEGVRYVEPARLPPHETCFAMTVHKSQGSQFGTVMLVLPERRSPLLTRELVYTGITRAKDALMVAGSSQVFREALDVPIRRASTLSERLWGKP